MKNLRLFGLDGFDNYARQIAKCLGVRLTPRQEKIFCDGEPFAASQLYLHIHPRIPTYISE